MAGSHSGGVTNSFNFNLYTYTTQNPVKYVDPTGMEINDVNDKEEIRIEVFIGEVDSIGVIVSYLDKKQQWGRVFIYKDTPGIFKKKLTKEQQKKILLVADILALVTGISIVVKIVSRQVAKTVLRGVIVYSAKKSLSKIFGKPSEPLKMC